jgi:hypothetical protein
MPTLHKNIYVAANPTHVWEAMRDIGALHTRLVPGFVVDTRVEPDEEAREVTFANGLIVREPILSVDDERRRLAWTVEGIPATHYNAVLTVEADGIGSRVHWTTDFLPREEYPSISTMQDAALDAMKRALESVDEVVNGTNGAEAHA